MAQLEKLLQPSDIVRIELMSAETKRLCIEL